MELANLSNTEFKTLVVRLIKGLIEYDKSIREEMKALLREIKKNPQETNSEGKEEGLKSMIRNIRKKETVNQNKTKKQEFKK